MSSPRSGRNGRSSGTTGASGRAAEWRRPLAALTLAYLAFETLSGLAIYLLPFAVPVQWTVVVHTVAGLAVLVPILVYQARHLAVYWSRPLGPMALMGYLATAATLTAVVTGLVLTWQSVFGRRIDYGFDLAHLLSTFALIAFLVPHVLIVLVRDRSLGGSAEGAPVLAAQRRVIGRAAVLTAALALLVAGLWAIAPGTRLVNEFPADYSYKYGVDRPFAPSLARTVTGGAYDSRTLSGSESCGTSGCHEEIVAEWRVSAHRWAAMDPGFQRIQEEMGKQNGAESTRYCGGCHDPISLFSGTKNIFTENLSGLAGYQEGVSCLACHSIRSTDLEGNANFVMAEPRRYLFEHDDGRAARLTRDFLIRAYPRQHLADLSKRLFKTPEYCAACHKQFIDKEVNNVGWVQLQNQYDNWRKSHWNHPKDPRKTVECRECHMPLTASLDPAAGDALDYNRTPEDGRTRSHRFLAANQVMPTLLKIPGGEEQVALTEKWLKGEIEIPEIADKWTSGPVVTLDLIAPERIAPGEAVALKAVMTSNKVGHDFPTGPLDIIQSWIELTVTDEKGEVVFASGGVSDRHFIQPGSFLFKAEPVDQYGNLIDRHNLWEMVGVRFRRSLFPGFSDSAEFGFPCPGGTGRGEVPPQVDRQFTFAAPPASAGTLRVRARLMYRKFDQYLLNFMFGEDSGLTSPVTEMARVEREIRIEGRAAALPAPAVTEPAGGAGKRTALP